LEHKCCEVNNSFSLGPAHAQARLNKRKIDTSFHKHKCDNRQDTTCTSINDDSSTTSCWEAEFCECPTWHPRTPKQHALRHRSPSVHCRDGSRWSHC